jgi:hypothetical protein
VRPESLTSEPIWVESNEQKEAARALEMLHVQLISAVIDPYAWKWVVLTLHHALRAFLVASLGREGGEPVPVEEFGRALRLQAYRSPADAGPLPSELATLFERAKRDANLKLGEDVDRDVAKLEIYHDALFGRVSHRWTMRVNELPTLTRNCLSVIEHLGWNPGRIAWQKENLTDLARVKFLASVKVLDALASRY